MGTLEPADSVQVPLDARVSALAARQHGVFSRSQVTALGASKHAISHRVTAGRWELVTPRVFRLAGSPSTVRQTLMAACLAWGAGAVISHRAAAALWRLAGFEFGAVELTIPRGRERIAPGLIHRNALEAVDVTGVDGIRVTTPARTLIDIASVAPREAVEEALDDALRRGLVSISRLRWRLDELGRGRRGVGVLRKLIDIRDPSAHLLDSVFERRLLRTLLGRGLPQPVLQHQIRKNGHLVAVVDFAYPQARLAIEADGRRWHSGRERFNRDRRRRNELTLLRWRIVHVTWDALMQNPDRVVAEVREALSGTVGV